MHERGLKQISPCNSGFQFRALRQQQQEQQEQQQQEQGLS